MLTRTIVQNLPFNPTTPHAAAGKRMEPPPSVPNAIGHKPEIFNT